MYPPGALRRVTRSRKEPALFERGNIDHGIKDDNQNLIKCMLQLGVRSYQPSHYQLRDVSTSLQAPHDVVHKLYPFATCLDLQSGITGGDCAYVVVARHALGREAPLHDVQRAALKLRSILAQHLEGYDPDTGCLPVFRQLFLSEATACKKTLDLAGDYFALFMTDVRTWHNDAQNGRRRVKNHAMDANSQLLRHAGLLKDRFVFDAFEQLLDSEINALTSRYNGVIPDAVRKHDWGKDALRCAFQYRAFHVRATSTNAVTTWMQGHEWLIMSTVVERPILILSAVSVRLGDDASQSFYAPWLTWHPEAAKSQKQMQEEPEIAVHDQFRSRTPLVLAFVGSPPNHYVAVVPNDDFSESDIYTLPESSASDPQIAGSGSDDDSDSRGNTDSSRQSEGSTRSKGASFAQLHGRAPFRTTIETAWRAKLDDTEASVFLLVRQVEEKHSVQFLQRRKTKRRIEYACGFSSWAQKRSDRDGKNAIEKNTTSNGGERSSGESEIGSCAGRLVSRLDDSVGTWVIDENNSSWEHCCPPMQKKRKMTKDTVLTLMCEDGASFARNGDIKRFMLSKFGVQINDTMATRCRAEYPSKKWGANEDEYFRRIPAFFKCVSEELRHGAFSYDLKMTESNVFCALFFSLLYTRQVVENGLPFLAIDACHYRYHLGGTWVAATTILANGYALPLAFAFVAANESSEVWDFFCEKLASVIPDDRELVIVSDRRAELATALQKWYPESDKVACSYHIAKNAKNHANMNYAALDTYVSWLAKTTTRREFETVKMKVEQKLKGEHAVASSKVLKFFSYLTQDHIMKDDWTLSTMTAESSSNRFGMVTSNLGEGTFSGMSQERSMPIGIAVESLWRRSHEKFMKLQSSIRAKIHAFVQKMMEQGFGESPAKDAVFADFACVDPGRTFHKVLGSFQLAAEEYPSSIELVREGTSGILNDTEPAATVYKATSDRNTDVYYMKIPVRGVDETRECRWHLCTCRKPFAYGVPCKHLLSLCKIVRGDEDARRPQWAWQHFVHPRLLMGSLYRCTEINVDQAVCVDVSHLQTVDLVADQVPKPFAPIKSAVKGRPKNKHKRHTGGGDTAGDVGSKYGRITSNGESSQQRRSGPRKCGNCGVAGHDVRTCTAEAQEAARDKELDPK